MILEIRIILRELLNVDLDVDRKIFFVHSIGFCAGN